MNKELRVYYTNQIPTNDFLYIDVKDVNEAKTVLNTLIKRDLHDESVETNVMGLEILKDDEWSEYYDDEGRNIDELMEQ